MPEFDFLTGFFTKESIDSEFDKIIAESNVDKKPFSVLLLDIDHFRTFNEKYGHLDGDNMLKYFAGTLRSGLEAHQTSIFKFGGDEFIIVFPGKKAREVYQIASNIIKIFNKRPFLLKGRLFKLHFSAGVATYPNDGRNTEEVLHKADRAMYFSKTHGRARVTIYGDIIWNTLARITGLIVFLSLILLLFFFRDFYKDNVASWLKKRFGKIGITLIMPSDKTGEKKSIKVPIIE